MRVKTFMVVSAVAGSLMWGAAASADTLEDVQEAEELKCGISDNLPGFSALNDKGEWIGFDTDYCRAFSAAVFGDANKVNYKPIAFNQSFTALQSGEVDVLSRSVTYTISRDTQLGMNFIPPTFYTGQGFMAHADLGVESVHDLDGAAICVLAGSVTERYIADYFKAHDMTFDAVPVETSGETREVYESGRCDAMSHELPSLAMARSRMKDPEAHVVLPEVIAKSYEAPAVREGDDRWGDIIRWVHFALVTAEELGITQDNVEEKAETSTNPVVRTFLGVDGNIGEEMGLSNQWTVDVIKAVGNYGEIYDRSFGKGGILEIERGMNDLYENGGLLYAPSWR